MWAGQLGKVDVTRHQIEVTPGARPRRAQPYRASHASRDVIAKKVQRQRDLGVIELSSAEWAFSVVLVPEPDGTMRFCLDYRQLNEVTVWDVYPLPRMDDCIDFLGDAEVFSTLDCYSGYWQIPVADEDRDKTTFVCHEGAYRYILLPSGLSNAPATFQRAIDKILGGSSGGVASCTSMTSSSSRSRRGSTWNTSGRYSRHFVARASPSRRHRRHYDTPPHDDLQLQSSWGDPRPPLVPILLVHRRPDKGAPPSWPGGPRGRCAGGSSW